MSNDLIKNLKEFLSNANLTTYEINAFLTLLEHSTQSGTSGIDAKKISKNSNVPGGRIYEVLESLQLKGMIEIIESRPKKFKALTLNKALEDLLNYRTIENKRKERFLLEQAKIIEANLYNSELSIKKEPIKIFWSTTFGFQSTNSLYRKFCYDLKEELLINGFINQNTSKIIPFGEKFFGPFKEAANRGVKIKFLWSFEHDERPLTIEQKLQDAELFKNIKENLKDMHGLSEENSNFGVKYIYVKTPTYYDVFDKERIIFKLQNPLKSYQIFACINVLDRNLAENLRQKFLNVWTFEALN
ncbi:MAG TPA: helix-turn-helix domain-containing protein [Candidatus Lokiarchaeia archaeon]